MYERFTADTDDEIVVFLLGMHINRWRAPRSWVPVVGAMPRMLAELRAKPELGMIKAYSGWIFGGPATVQYWRSYDQLVAYARSADGEHLPAWRAFNKLATRTDAVGIWHETYKVMPGQWEAIYGGMPPRGLLGAVGGRPLARSSTSRERLHMRHSRSGTPQG